jgi:hypothetical protein
MAHLGEARVLLVTGVLLPLAFSHTSAAFLLLAQQLVTQKHKFALHLLQSAGAFGRSVRRASACALRVICTVLDNAQTILLLPQLLASVVKLRNLFSDLAFELDQLRSLVSHRGGLRRDLSLKCLYCC